MSRPTRVLVAGLSTRAAAESAARAGYDVTAIDAFGDLDQHAAVRSLAVPRDVGAPFSPSAAARAGRGLECDAVAYLGNFENHPSAVLTLASGRALWGNPPDVLRRVRTPSLLTKTLWARGLPAPAVRERHPRAAAHRQNPRGHMSCDWMVKPLRSGGGHRVRPWREGTRVPRDCYLQERVDGTPGSVAFVASQGRAVPLGVFRQLVGEPAFGGSGFRYCGSILSGAHEGFAHDDALVSGACALASAAAEAFGLVGVNGVDFVARAGVPYAVEVNPRWSASMELVERASGLSVFGAHAAACLSGTLPDVDLAHAPSGQGAVGKAIVYARHAVTVGDTRGWLDESDIRDVPRAGERIPAGRPVCTVFANAPDAVACEAALARRASGIYEELARWARAAA